MEQEVKHLKEFKVENFKCFESFEMKDIGQFNLIVGDNINLIKANTIINLDVSANLNLTKNNFTVKTVSKGKQENKKLICKNFNINNEVPLIGFIGRLVGEKAADILPNALEQSLQYFSQQCSFIILGSGEPTIEAQLNQIKETNSNFYNAYIGYNEELSHLLYAGADFLLMPSRVEPCGLNQMYAMRYGTVPMVRSTGGLKDTVIDVGDTGGFGIRFNDASTYDILYSVQRAISLFADKEKLQEVRTIMMQIDNSWEKTVSAYDEIYA